MKMKSSATGVNLPRDMLNDFLWYIYDCYLCLNKIHNKQHALPDIVVVDDAVADDDAVPLLSSLFFDEEDANFPGTQLVVVPVLFLDFQSFIMLLYRTYM